MFNRTCLALGYFAFLTLLFIRGIPHYSTVPLILLGIIGLMILTVMIGVFWAAPSAKERRQFSLLRIFIFTAACAMLLGAMTGLLRASGERIGFEDLPIVAIALGVLLFFSFPFAAFLAESTIWTAVHLIRIPKVRSVVRRLIP